MEVAHYVRLRHGRTSLLWDLHKAVEKAVADQKERNAIRPKTVLKDEFTRFQSAKEVLKTCEN